jgi:small subunit ribosomal protein S18
VANQRNKRARTKPSDARNRLRRGRPKVCLVCSERIEYLDYKNTAFLRRFMSDRGKIKSRANTGTCVQHQHEVAVAIKNAREVALLPYAVRTMAADKGGGRRGRGAGPGRSSDRGGAGRPSGSERSDSDDQTTAVVETDSPQGAASDEDQVEVPVAAESFAEEGAD